LYILKITLYCTVRETVLYKFYKFYYFIVVCKLYVKIYIKACIKCKYENYIKSNKYSIYT